MSDVALNIGGRRYRVACAPGEEERLGRLGAMIDRKLAAEPGLSNQSEPRMLLFAALLLADQVDELEKLPGAAAPSQPPTPGPTTLVGPEAEMLERLADRLETIASELEEATGNA